MRRIKQDRKTFKIIKSTVFYQTKKIFSHEQYIKISQESYQPSKFFKRILTSS